MTTQPMSTDELERDLRAVARAIDWPATPDLASVVGARLRSSAPGSTAPTSPRSRRRILVRSVLLAAAILALTVGAVVAVGYGLGLLRIEFGAVPSVTPTPAASTAAASPAAAFPAATTGSPRPSASTFGAGLRLGTARTLEEARAETAFPILVPAALGAPDAVFIGGSSLRGQVALLYAAGDGRPERDALDGAGILVTQNEGRNDANLAGKLVDAGLASVEHVAVDGAPGLWISGPPHVFWYLDERGDHLEDSRRVVGDTLAWERDGVLYRIEGASSLDDALAIAATMG